MTEAEWLACADPAPMLHLLRAGATERKLRLFACACTRQVWTLLSGERGRSAVRVAERFADGRATREELMEARNAEWDARRGAASAAGEADGASHAGAQAALHAWCAACAAARATTSPTPWSAAANAAVAAARVAVYTAARRDPDNPDLAQEARAAIGRRQADLLRDLFGNPFRPVLVEPSWLRWNDGCVRRIAREVYDRGRFADLSVLADALEEAGCADPDLLAHCRAGGEHARGCWVVDALLDKH